MDYQNVRKINALLLRLWIYGSMGSLKKALMNIWCGLQLVCDLRSTLSRLQLALMETGPMEKGPFIDGLPWFSMAMLNNQMVVPGLKGSKTEVSGSTGQLDCEIMFLIQKSYFRLLCWGTPFPDTDPINTLLQSERGHFCRYPNGAPSSWMAWFWGFCSSPVKSVLQIVIIVIPFLYQRHIKNVWTSLKPPNNKTTRL